MVCSQRFYPKPEKAKVLGEYSETVEELHAKTNRKFFSPYSQVCIGKWRGKTNHFTETFDRDPDRGRVSDKSEKLVNNIKNSDMKINKVLSSIITIKSLLSNPC